MSIGEELARLADLRDRGVLTEEEFAEQKAALLGKRSPEATVESVPIAPGDEPANGPNLASEPPKQRSKVGKVTGWGCLGFLLLIFILIAIPSPGPNEAATAEDAKGEAAPASQIRHSEGLSRSSS